MPPPAVASPVALDLVIRGGQVVTPHGVGPWEVGVAGGSIVAVALPGSLPTDGARVLEASGLVARVRCT
ncbi:MAG: hypothetical protein DMD79_09020 [Candidatus Rokuibacteriota bacterium]|nr:MAG: hypothetical protein DMD79_09020 [Candidatus Rokubacteria bacterium]